MTDAEHLDGAGRPGPRARRRARRGGALDRVRARRAASAAASSTRRWEDVATALQVSTYSYKSLAVACQPLMRAGRRDRRPRPSTPPWPGRSTTGWAWPRPGSSRPPATWPAPRRAGHPGQPGLGRPAAARWRRSPSPASSEFEDAWSTAPRSAGTSTDPEPAARACLRPAVGLVPGHHRRDRARRRRLPRRRRLIHGYASCAARDRHGATCSRAARRLFPRFTCRVTWRAERERSASSVASAFASARIPVQGHCGAAAAGGVRPDAGQTEHALQRALPDAHALHPSIGDDHEAAGEQAVPGDERGRGELVAETIPAQRYEPVGPFGDRADGDRTQDEAGKGLRRGRTRRCRTVPTGSSPARCSPCSLAATPATCMVARTQPMPRHSSGHSTPTDWIRPAARSGCGSRAGRGAAGARPRPVGHGEPPVGQQGPDRCLDGADHGGDCAGDGDEAELDTRYAK